MPTPNRVNMLSPSVNQQTSVTHRSQYCDSQDVDTGNEPQYNSPSEETFEVQMETIVTKTAVKCSGVLNEKTETVTLNSAFEDFTKSNEGSPLTLDFEDVTTANSVGLLILLKALERRKSKTIFENAPVWLIESIICLEEFFTYGATVGSFFARFYCPATDKMSDKLLIIGKDVPAIEDYSTFTISLKDEAGNELEPDFDPSYYFSFIANHLEVFKRS
jgi:hypothetical protein